MQASQNTVAAFGSRVLLLQQAPEHVGNSSVQRVIEQPPH